MEQKIDLNDIANRIRANLAHERTARLELGRDLAVAKANMPHGKFGKWLKAEFTLNVRTAQRYIDYHKNISQLMGSGSIEYDSLSYLSSEAVCALAAMKEEAQSAMLDKIKRGHKPRIARVVRSCSQTTKDAMTKTDPVASNKITTFPPLKKQFGQHAAEAAQKAVRLLKSKLHCGDLVALEKLVEVGPDAFGQALSREVRASSAGKSSVRRS